MSLKNKNPNSAKTEQDPDVIKAEALTDNEPKVSQRQSDNFFKRALFPVKTDQTYWLNKKERILAWIATALYAPVAILYLVYTHKLQEDLFNEIKPLFDKLPTKSQLKSFGLPAKETLAQWHSYLLSQLHLPKNTTQAQYVKFLESHKGIPPEIYIIFVVVFLMLAFGSFYARRSLLIVPCFLAMLQLSIPIGLPWAALGIYLLYHLFSFKKPKQEQITEERQNKSGKRQGATKESPRKPGAQSPLSKVRQNRATSSSSIKSKRYTPKSN